MVQIDNGGGGNLSESSVQPRIESVEPIVMEARFQLPWNRKSNQTACGTTIQVPAGDVNWRVVLEGVISMDQLKELDALRSKDRIAVTTEAFGKKKVTPDQLDIRRAGDEDIGEIDDKVGPLFSFQFQTKEIDQSSGGLFG